jgi:hypothetical protein
MIAPAAIWVHYVQVVQNLTFTFSDRTLHNVLRVYVPGTCASSHRAISLVIAYLIETGAEPRNIFSRKVAHS